MLRQHLENGLLLQGRARVSSTGDFAPEPIPNRITELPTLLQSLNTTPKSVLIVDARSNEEYNGASRYGTGATNALPAELSYVKKHLCEGRIAAADRCCRSLFQGRERASTLYAHVHETCFTFTCQLRSHRVMKEALILYATAGKTAAVSSADAPGQFRCPRGSFRSYVAFKVYVSLF
jgi:3-mercaptopyruvate sulfurtransferase SseA